MIRAENVFKVFGDHPENALPLLEEGKTKDEIREETGLTVGVNDVSFELERGEIFVIMGLSGSGKSTLLRCVNRLIEPTAGSIYLRDYEGEGETNITQLDPKDLRKLRRERMSMVFQNFGLFPHRTVRDNVAYGLEVQGRPKKERDETAEETLEIVGLGGWGDSLPAQLSGGMQQRVGLARALATQAEVLLMDEPFSALDPLIKVNMQNELLRIQGELRRTILFITHDLDEALRIGTHISIMEGGKIVQKGTPEEIIVNPKTEYVADFVEHADPTNVMTAKTVALPIPGRRFQEQKKENGVAYYARGGFPNVLYAVGDDGRFEGLFVDGDKAREVTLDDALAENMPDVRKQDTVLTCGADHTLRQVLRGRTYSLQPLMVLEGRKLTGVIGERELVNGILEKRAHRDGGDADGESAREREGSNDTKKPEHTLAGSR